MKNCLRKTAQNIREKISIETKDRPISLMVDIVTKHGRSILGFSLQYIVNGNHKIRSIGMIHLDASHTAVYLAELIVNRLNELDNGANMLKIVRDIRNMEFNMPCGQLNNENAAANQTVR